MTGESAVLYKGLVFRIDQTLNYLELIVDEQNFSDQKKYISSVSIMLEFALATHPRYIILNREHHNFSVAKSLYSFTSRNILFPLKHDRVKRIICIGTVEEYQERYKTIEEQEPFIKWAGSKEAALDWIRNEEVLTPQF